LSGEGDGDKLNVVCERAFRMKMYFFVILAFLSAVSLPALAQNNQPRPAAAAPVATENSVRTERTVFDSWVLTCQQVVGNPKSKRCSATLSIVEEQSKQVAFLWTIGKNAAGAPTAVLTTPTSINLTNGLELKIGKGAARKLSFWSCDANSCEAVMPLDEGVLKEARTGDDASATITMRDGRTVRFSIINKGFERAVAAVRS
jgi:invasion protein IalB